MNFIKRKFIPYGRQDISLRDIYSVFKVLKRDLITQGPEIESFEKEISREVNSKFAIAVNSATSALHISCIALGLRENDIIYTSAITFVASANCGRFCGAKVEFLDIEPKTGLIDINKLEHKLQKASKENKLPKIIIPVHLGGASCDMKGLYSLKQKFGFKIIEDASHAIGGKYFGEPVGNCKYSEISIFSFHPVKIITTGEGGIATTNDKEIAEKLFNLRSHGITKNPKEFIYEPKGLWYYEQNQIGFNFRMTDFQAALGKSQLNRLKKIVLIREKLFKVYKKSFAGTSLKMQEIPKDVNSAYHLGICFMEGINEEKHKFIFHNLRKLNIGVQLHYLPVHLQPYYRNLGYKEGDFPCAEEYSKKVLSLPLYSKLRGNEQKFVINSILKLVNIV